MNATNLYVRGGDASNMYLEAKDSAILHAGFANFVKEYKLLCNYQGSERQVLEEAKSCRSGTGESSPDKCSNQSSSKKSSALDGEENPCLSEASATNNQCLRTGSFSFFLTECTKDAEKEAKRIWDKMCESEQALYAPKEDSVKSCYNAGDPSVNGISPAPSDNIFGRGTSSRACAKNVRRRHCKPRFPKPRMCRKPRSMKRCSKPRSIKRCSKPKSIKRCHKPKSIKRCHKPRAARRCPKSKHATPRCKDSKINFCPTDLQIKF